MALGDQTRRNIARRIDAMEPELKALAIRTVPWMRQRARWRNRTGLTRARLTVAVERHRQGNRDVFVLAPEHGVPWGKWLETIHGAAMGHRARMTARELAQRRYAGPLSILWPTVDYLRPQIRRFVQRHWAARPGGVRGASPISVSSSRGKSAGGDR